MVEEEITKTIYRVSHPYNLCMSRINTNINGNSKCVYRLLCTAYTSALNTQFSEKKDQKDDKIINYAPFNKKEAMLEFPTKHDSQVSTPKLHTKQKSIAQYSSII